MVTRTMEIGVGVFVALGLAALLMLAMKVSNIAALTEGEGYEVKARFENIGGLKVRSPVRMGGVLVGRVKGVELDDDAYEAVVRLAILPQYTRIPTDSSASILTESLLGAQYIGLEAGAEEEFLKEGDELTLTQSAVVLEQLIGSFLYNKADEGGGQ